jgi:DNA polymerase
MVALADIISSCQACGLCRERQQAVTGEGVMQPAIMVIGEAPGDYEDRQGRPFVDRPGLMLDNMLSAIQSSRTQNVYVSNIVKCRPPGNRNPKPAELSACKPYLLRQIELVRPFSILAVGRAAQALLETDEPLETLRQVTHSLLVAGQKIPLIVTSHPVTLLNHPAEKAAVWQDLLLVKTVSGL